MQRCKETLLQLSSVLRFVFFFALLSFAAAVSARPYINNNDGTVSDGATGLVWMRCAVGQDWNGNTCTGTPRAHTWAEAIASKADFAGKNDWRLPSIRELQSIVDHSLALPAIDSTIFPATESDRFWVKTPSAATSGSAWFVQFITGETREGNAELKSLVRLLRGEESLGTLNPARPADDYVDNRNGTVTHIPTGLTWQRCANGQSWTGNTCSGAAIPYTWSEATTLVDGFAGYSDWRLPSVDELLTLVDYKQTRPSINDAIFPGQPQNYFWSATVFALSAYLSNEWDAAWTVGFETGESLGGIKSYPFSVRMVRGDAPPIRFALTASATGDGQGIIVSAPSGISCRSNCTGSFTADTMIALSAIPDIGNTFLGWSGDCSGTATCTVKMNTSRRVTARFESNRSRQSISFGVSPVVFVGGTGRLSATSTSGLPVLFGSASSGICSVSDTLVSGLAAGICIITANQAGDSYYSAAQEVTQSFLIRAVETVLLKIIRTGSGNVTSSPAGINCGTTCDAAFLPDSSVELSATPAATSVFSGWNGDCAGVQACNLILGAGKTVSAYFTTVTAPAAPVIRKISVNQGSALIDFVMPVIEESDSFYTAVCTTANRFSAKEQIGNKSPITVRGLLGGAVYTCLVKADNGVGTSVSAESEPFVAICADLASPLRMLLLD